MIKSFRTAHLLLLVWMTAPLATFAQTHNTLTAAEKKAGWTLLFDGQTLNGWKRYGKSSIGPMWKAEEGMIVCLGKEGLKEEDLGSLMTVGTYGNFELVVDWKISPIGNSGILYHVVEDPALKKDYESGPEYQLLDDTHWPDPLKDAQKTGSYYDMFPAPADKTLKPVGEWNNSRIVWRNGHIEHWLNGQLMVSIDENSPAFAAQYKNSKWTGYPKWNQAKSGHISLQDHGSKVYFRNIRIRKI